jgi:hypothetical protein
MSSRRQKKKEKLQLNGTRQVMIYDNDVNLLDEHINTIKKNLSDFSKKDDLEANTKKSKYSQYVYVTLSECRT